jgi:probable phosphoglycerate mutase
MREGPWRIATGAGVIVAFIDGGARGNPGPAGYGVRIEDGAGNLLEELHGPLGIATNNIAEYNGLLAALRWAADHGERHVHIRSDSELLVKQMRGEYRVKHPGLQPLYARAKLLAAKIGRVTLEHVRREQNREADRLSNLAMDESEAALAADTGRSEPSVDDLETDD